MKFTKYFSDTKRLLQFTLVVIEAHCPELFVLDVWTDCVKCTGMGATCILPDQVDAVKSICLAYKEAVSEFIKLVVHYDICDYHECLVNIKAEMAPIYKKLEDAGIYFSSNMYWMNTPERVATADCFLTLGETAQLLTIAWNKLVEAFDISWQLDPPGYKYLGICKECGHYYVKNMSNQMFCSKPCGQAVRYRRYAAKKKANKI